jgi:hypothetical protein
MEQELNLDARSWPRKLAFRVKVSLVLLGFVVLAVLFGLIAPSLFQYTKGEVVEMARQGRDAKERVLVVDKGISLMVRSSVIQVTWGSNSDIAASASAAAPRKLARLALSRIPGTTQVPPEFWVISGTRGFWGFGFLMQGPETVEGVRRMAVSVPTWFLAALAGLPAGHYYWRRMRASAKAKKVKAVRYAV